MQHTTQKTKLRGNVLTTHDEAYEQARRVWNHMIDQRPALVVSERTVETHVGNILAKLGFSSRRQIAVWVAEKSG